MNHIEANITLLYGPHKKKLAECPATFIKWLTSTCDRLSLIKECNFLIPHGPYQGLRINALYEHELREFVDDDSQCLFAHQIAADKLANFTDENVCLERAIRPPMKKPKQAFTPRDLNTLPMTLPVLKVVETTVNIQGERYYLYEMTEAELRALYATADAYHKSASILAAIRFKFNKGDKWRPKKRPK